MILFKTFRRFLLLLLLLFYSSRIGAWFLFQASLFSLLVARVSAFGCWLFSKRQKRFFVFSFIIVFFVVV